MIYRGVLCVWVVSMYLDVSWEVLSEPVAINSNCHPFQHVKHQDGACSSRLLYPSHEAVASICCRYFCLSEFHLNVCQVGVWMEAITWQTQRKKGSAQDHGDRMCKVDSVHETRWLMLNRGPEDISVLLLGLKTRLHLFPPEARR